MRPTFSTNVSARGFTLVETVVAAGASVFVFAAAATMFLYGSKSTVAMGNYAVLDMNGLNALDTMTTDIRQANNVTNCTASLLQLLTVDPNSGATNTLSYTYNSTAGTLTRAYEGSTNTLLTGIVANSLTFAMYQRNPIGGSVSNYATTNVTLCKVVQFGWTCSLSSFGSLSNTACEQSGEVVIRKE